MEYINIATLLEPDVLMDTDFSRQLIINEDGTLEYRPRAAKSIHTIFEWTNAFIIFASIYLKKHPDKASKILQYMNVIREPEAGHKGLKWKIYNKQFLYRQIHNPTSWAKLHPDLWLRVMTVTGDIY